jgi:hypothetical protein
MEYAEKRGKREFFVNVTMSFACVGLHGTSNGDLEGHAIYVLPHGFANKLRTPEPQHSVPSEAR